MNVDAAHPDLIDLDTGDIYEWEPEPAGGGEPGYSHSEDHDFAWLRTALEETRRLAEIAAVDPAELDRLRDLSLNPPEDEDD
ncbi:hypothetical protein CU254_42510 (plasmid) [Amycolatopsis sp. AA4]|uniref:hypothetical protein n=1 Tax=Actinomycetes TaxID=1760 RepID=UPI0001B57165|nr:MULTISPECIES: hypothetical protein [Actinomycetes]ATY17260.1 hypothetical protein CU254_42510 [Amycolatopsis sp. AA4]